MSRTLVTLARDGKTYVLEFKWRTSRGRDTWGYNVCSAYIDGRKVGESNGGGYDMQGAALQEWLTQFVGDADEFYGLYWGDPKGKEAPFCSPRKEGRYTVPGIDGSCGMDGILRSLGFKQRWL